MEQQVKFVYKLWPEDNNHTFFYVELLNDEQKAAWEVIENNDVVFLIGPAGTGKSFLSIAYGVDQILKKKKRKLVLTRPIVEAGESLGYLPGGFVEKVNPFMLPLYDCIDQLTGTDTVPRERIDNAIEIAPLAYLRGRTLNDSICILDESQNCSRAQLKLFLTRLGKNSKMLITGDPQQSDLRGEVALFEIIRKLDKIPGVGAISFTEAAIVRHPLVAEILRML